MATAGIETQRRQLAKIYIAVVAADGMSAVHRLLSAAVIQSRKPKPAAAKLKPTDTMEWKGRVLPLGSCMILLNDRQRIFVAHHVHGGLTFSNAARTAGYKRDAGSLRHSARVQDAIAEERERHI
jgi:hypothetical protein